ncbi:Uncharacterised protein [Vibrio cholerae]|nr:Uncharacterised protein [Vibrio cholerae]
MLSPHQNPPCPVALTLFLHHLQPSHPHHRKQSYVLHGRYCASPWYRR